MEYPDRLVRPVVVDYCQKGLQALDVNVYSSMVGEKLVIKGVSSTVGGMGRNCSVSSGCNQGVRKLAPPLPVHVWLHKRQQGCD
jgi:hypothetical protein